MNNASAMEGSFLVIVPLCTPASFILPMCVEKPVGQVCL